jgi:site-specific recombinase XerD
MKQRNASEHTIASYRDTFRLLLRYLQQHCGKSPSIITLQDLNADVIVDFLNHLEKERGNKVRSRNVRLAAIQSFFHYIAFEEPSQADLIQRVLAIQSRWKKKLGLPHAYGNRGLIKSIDQILLGCLILHFYSWQLKSTASID